MFLRIATVAASIMTCSALAASAAGTGEHGTDAFTVAYVTTWSDTMPLGSQTARLYESDGVSTNDAGRPMFNNMGVHCFGLGETVAGVYSGQGNCAHTDKDGDKIFDKFAVNGPAGTFTVIGGTGKYSGLTGTGSFTRQMVQSPDGHVLSLVHEKVDWKSETGAEAPAD
jgi:hypothetical protein